VTHRGQRGKVDAWAEAAASSGLEMACRCTAASSACLRGHGAIHEPSPLKMRLQLQSKAMAAAARGQGCSAQGGECNTHRPVPFSRSRSLALVNLSAPSKAQCN
jgi:hypothetical protein